MGVIEADAVDQHSIPLKGVTFELGLGSLLTIPPRPPVPIDTRTTDSSGKVFLDTHQWFCPLDQWVIVGTYGDQILTKVGEMTDPRCQAPMQLFQFNVLQPGQCVSTSDCNQGYQCVQGRCVPLSNGGGTTGGPVGLFVMALLIAGIIGGISYMTVKHRIHRGRR